MRILIYSESPEAKAIAEELKADKNNNVSIRSSDPDFFDAKDVEPCDEVICWDMHVVHGYADKAVIDYRGPKVEDEEEKAKPVSRKKATKGKPKG